MLLEVSRGHEVRSDRSMHSDVPPRKSALSQESLARRSRIRDGGIRNGGIRDGGIRDGVAGWRSRRLLLVVPWALT